MMADSLRPLAGPSGGGGLAARYWRMRALDGPTGGSWSDALGAYAMHVSELQFYTSTDLTGANLCLGNSGVASSVFDGTDTHKADNAFDGDVGTRWLTNIAAAVAPQWIYVDLVVPAEVHSLILTTLSQRFPKNFYLEKSQDALSWEVTATIATTNVSTFTATDL